MKNSILTSHSPIYPYLITWVCPAVYHVIVLPRLGVDRLKKIALSQEFYNDLPTCLVLDEQTASAGGILMTDRLRPCFNVEVSSKGDPSYASRLEILAGFIEVQSKNCLFGDLTRGARQATAEELKRLPGRVNGIPNGLSLCETCGNYRGMCLDTEERTKNQVMTVHCVCENFNRCALCHKLLYHKKLNANYYSPRDNKIWHVPGFSAFSHQCLG